jgi:hypothetical protein
MKMNAKHRSVAQIESRGLVLVAFLAMILSAAVASRAQTMATPRSGPVAKSTAVEANATLAPIPGTMATSLVGQAPSKGPHEGITAHGYWTIDVRNPDGKLAKHLEFENQLCTSFVDPTSGASVFGGDQLLTLLLSGSNYVAGDWSIVLGTQELVQLPSGGPGGGGFGLGPNCGIYSQFSLGEIDVQNGSTALSSLPNSSAGFPATDSIPLALLCSGNCFPTLKVGGSSTGTSIMLSGQFTVPAGNSVPINAVGTDLFKCFGPLPTGLTVDACKRAGNYYGINAGTIVSNPPGIPCAAGVTAYAPNGVLLSGDLTFNSCTPREVPAAFFIETYNVAGQFGRSPFSGVVLTGTNGVPAPFTVSAGQTVAVTWTLSFQ